MRYLRKFRHLLHVAACLLPACGAPAGAADLVFWTIETAPYRQATVRHLLDAYEALEQNGRVRHLAVREEELLAKFQESVTAGSPPDVIHADAALLAALQRNRHLDVPGANAIMGELDEDRFYPAVLNALRTDWAGDHFAVPYSAWLYGIWYRADWFARDGLPQPDSWQSLLAAARRYSDPDAKRYALVMGTGKRLYAAHSFLWLAGANGVIPVDARGRPTLDSRAMTEALEIYRELARFVSPNGGDVSDSGEFLAGDAAMLFQSSGFAHQLASDARRYGGVDFDKNVRVVTSIFNQHRAGFGGVYGLGLVANRGPEKRAAAQRLVRFLFRRDVYISWLHMSPGGMLPVLPEIASDAAFHNDLGGIYRRNGLERIKTLAHGVQTLVFPGTPAALANADVLTQSIVPELVERARHEGAAAAARWAQKAAPLALGATRAGVSQ